MADSIIETPDYSADLRVLEAATEQITEAGKKTKAELRLAALRQEIASQKTSSEIRASIDSLKGELNVSGAIDGAQTLSETDKKALEQQIKEALSDLAPDKIDASLRTTERLIDMVRDPKYKSLLQSYAGSLMLEKFEANNQRIVILGNKNIAISPIDPSKQDVVLDRNNTTLQGNINSYIREKPSVLDTIRSGMLFRAHATGENPAKAQDVQSYFTSLKNKQNLSAAEATLLLSQSGFADMVNLPEMREVQKLQKEVQQTLVPQSNLQSGGQVPSTVGEGIGTVGGAIGKIAGAGAKGGIGVIADIFNGATKEGGAWGGIAVLGGLIASIWKFGLWKTLAGVFGIGVVSEAAAGRIDLNREAGKVKKAGAAAATTIGGLTNSLTGGSIGKPKPTEKPSESSEKAELTEDQTWFHKEIMKDTELKSKIDAFALAQKNNGGSKLAAFSDYMNYIEKNMGSFPLEKILSRDHKKSIYSMYADFDISIDSSMDPVIFKKILRAYIQGTGYENLTGTGENQGDTEKQKFIEIYDLDDDIKNKSLLDILPKIHNKRPGLSHQAGLRSAQPTSAETRIIQIEISGGKKVIQNTVVGMTQETPVYDENGAEVTLLNGSKKLSVTARPRLIGTELKEINGQKYIQIEYAKERMYVSPATLRALS